MKKKQEEQSEEKKVDEQAEVKELIDSGVRTYFTKEINDQITEMGVKEMESSLKGFVTSREWIAMLKYVNMRTVFIDTQLRSANPTTDPHTISWAQGALAGICDIENYVIELNAPKPTVEEDDSNPAGV